MLQREIPYTGKFPFILKVVLGNIQAFVGCTVPID